MAAVVAKGGIPDADAPSDPQSTRYWVHLGAEENTLDETTTTVNARGHLTGSAAMQALALAQSAPQAAQAVSDPLAMVRSQLEALPATSAPSTAAPSSAAPSRSLAAGSAEQKNI